MRRTCLSLCLGAALLGVLIYLITNGEQMQKRTMSDAAAMEKAQKDYIRSVAGGGGSTADAIEAIDYLTELKRAGVNLVAINASWGGGGYSQALADAIDRAGAQNILFVAASGNGDFFGNAINTDASPHYPSSYDLPSIISVTAIDINGAKASWAN